MQVYSLLSSSFLQMEYVPDLSQEPVAMLPTAAIILPLASLETLSFHFLQIVLLATVARILSLVSFEICIIFYAFLSLSQINLWCVGERLGLI